MRNFLTFIVVAFFSAFALLGPSSADAQPPPASLQPPDGRPTAPILTVPTTIDSSKIRDQISAVNETVPPDSSLQTPPPPPNGLDLSAIRTYTIKGISVTGVTSLDRSVLVTISGLRVGDEIEIPGERLGRAINNLWKQGLFGDVQIRATQVVGTDIWLEFYLAERPRLTRYDISRGIKKNDADDIRDKLKLQKGRVVTESLKATIRAAIKNFYVEKGYADIETRITEFKDSSERNGVVLKLDIRPGKKLKIAKIDIQGNQAIEDGKLKRKMKETKEFKLVNILKSSKFIKAKYEEDKKNLIAAYAGIGHRDAKLISDSTYRTENGRIGIIIRVSEGKQYRFRNITFTGNALHSTEELSNILGIKKGDIYSQTALEQHLFQDPSGRDVSSLYMDDGYLFFQVVPAEVAIIGDSVDVEMRIYEGPQATINKVTVIGNTKTSDHVILREIRTRPGQKFSRADIIRTQRELSQLGYFDPAEMGVTPRPNQADGTVDIEYKVAEKSSDQIELSGGWGQGRIVGSLGLTLNNFSARKMFDPSMWRPIPGGDGQRLQLRAQSTGIQFQSYNASFTEPWMGGKKPNSFTVSGYYSVQNYNFVTIDNRLRPTQSIRVLGSSVSIGKRLKWPDDFFTLLHSVNYQRFFLDNAGNFGLLNTGVYNNFYFKETLARNSVDQPIFPRSGSLFQVAVQFTPPYSLLGVDESYTNTNAGEQDLSFRLVEMHKTRIDGSYYFPLGNKLVLKSGFNLGFIGTYAGGTGQAPFGRFFVGGDGLTGFQLDDRELVGLRGYGNNSLTPSDFRNGASTQIGGEAFQKFTLELRYPLSLNPSATIWVQTFAEAGNNFRKVNLWDPFNNRRAIGVGARVFLPMFGLLGLDYGYGLDPLPGDTQRGRFHVSIGQQF